MNAASLQRFGAPDVVFPKRIAAVDNNVVGREQPGELDNRVFGDLAGGQHQPDRARGTQLVDESVQTLGADRAVTTQGGNSIGVMIVDHRLMAVLHKAACDVAAHASETNHADLHVTNPDQTSAANPKFARICRTRGCELRVQKRHDKHTFASVLIDSEVRTRAPQTLTNFGIGTLVPRTRSSHRFAEPADANFGFKSGTTSIHLLVSLSIPKFARARPKHLRTSESGH